MKRNFMPFISKKLFIDKHGQTKILACLDVFSAIYVPMMKYELLDIAAFKTFLNHREK